VHRVVDNLYLRIFGLLLVVIDVVLVFVRLSETGWKVNGSGGENKVPRPTALMFCPSGRGP
jgi:hypothetical protein